MILKILLTLKELRLANEQHVYQIIRLNLNEVIEYSLLIIQLK